MRRCLHLLILFCAWSAASTLSLASPAFDLTGPKVDVHVKRGAVTLPISETPSLMPGDRLWIHPELPVSQSERFVLVVAFLRGSTNPPPAGWFTEVDTWTRAVRQEGFFVNVPAGAQQALMFLAPATGGGFNTLRKTVEDQPGSFVRASQDLQAASWERMRLEAYLADVRATSQTKPQDLQARAQMAARSLGIKIRESCFSKPTDQQVSCLSQNSEGMVLDDSNAQSLVDQLANGSALDMVNQLSYSSMAGGGMYSPYVGAVVDMVKILGSMHTAHYQYIPALALPVADSLNLRLNMPPSFRNPKSVVVVALPPIGPSQPEPLQSVNPENSFCALKPGLVLPAEGAPLIYATGFAHDLTLQITAQGSSAGKAVEVPLRADAAKGGLVPTSSMPRLPAGQLTAVVHGKWGFDDWEGPRYQLYSPQPGKWAVAFGDESALVVGRADRVHLKGESTVCVERVEEQANKEQTVDLAWKNLTPDSLAVTVPLKDAAPGRVRLEVYQYGLRRADRIEMTAYAMAASLNGLSLNAGDAEALLKGTRLDEVAKASLSGITFKPSKLSRAGNLDQLILKAAKSTSGLQPGATYTALVELKDGRQLSVPVTVDPPRPEVTLLNEGVQDGGSAVPAPVKFGSPNDLPVDSQLVFFLRSDTPVNFPLDEKVEVALAASNIHTMLSFSGGGLMLEDARTVVAKLEPLKRFGPSAFGPLRVRAVAADGVTGKWVPLGTLVRLPDFAKLRCPRSLTEPCTLSGANLFLADSIADTPNFEVPANVPPEFTGTQIQVPHPVNGILYLKLRDDPKTVQTLTLAATYPPPPVRPAVAAPTAQTALSSTPSAASSAAEPSASPSTAPAGSSGTLAKAPMSPANPSAVPVKAPVGLSPSAGAAPPASTAAPAEPPTASSKASAAPPGAQENASGASTKTARAPVKTAGSPSAPGGTTPPASSGSAAPSGSSAKTPAGSSTPSTAAPKTPATPAPAPPASSGSPANPPSAPAHAPASQGGSTSPDASTATGSSGA